MEEAVSQRKLVNMDLVDIANVFSTKQLIMKKTVEQIFAESIEVKQETLKKNLAADHQCRRSDHQRF